MTAESHDFDLSAAWLRRTKGDMNAFIEALAARLEAALPDAVTIERHRDGLFSRASHVSRIEFRTETGVLALAIDHGRVHATRSKIVRGVSIGSEEITVPDWLNAVLLSTRMLGADANAAHDALHTFLIA